MGGPEVRAGNVPETMTFVVIRFIDGDTSQPVVIAEWEHAISLFYSPFFSPFFFFFSPPHLVLGFGVERDGVLNTPPRHGTAGWFAGDEYEFTTTSSMSGSVYLSRTSGPPRR